MNKRSLADWPAVLSSPSRCQEGGNEPSCRALSAELDTVRPIPPREAGGLPVYSKRTWNAAKVSIAARGVQASGCGREATAPEPAALPCQNSNNSNKPRPRYRLLQVPHAPNFFTDREKKHVWDEQDEDTLHRIGVPTGTEARSAFHLRLNVAAFIQHWGRSHCLFFTVTDEKNLHPTQFARRWNSFLVRNGTWIVSYIRVLEPQKKGRPHYHILVAVQWDTKPDDFDWQAVSECQQERRANGLTPLFRELRKRYRSSAATELVAMWKLLRKVLPRYGLGRSELLPIRKGKEAISEYIGKYLEAGLIIRKHSWKGCRRVEFDRRNKLGWLACTRVFAWHSPGAIVWRKRVAEFATSIGAVDMTELKEKVGPKWAYRLREAISLANPQDWEHLLQLFRRNYLNIYAKKLIACDYEKSK